jgi:hypothetical protein
MFPHRAERRKVAIHVRLRLQSATDDVPSANRTVDKLRDGYDIINVVAQKPRRRTEMHIIITRRFMNSVLVSRQHRIYQGGMTASDCSGIAARVALVYLRFCWFLGSGLSIGIPAFSGAIISLTRIMLVPTGI